MDTGSFLPFLLRWPDLPKQRGDGNKKEWKIFRHLDNLEGQNTKEQKVPELLQPIFEKTKGLEAQFCSVLISLPFLEIGA